MNVINLPSNNITQGTFIVVGTDATIHFAQTEDAAENIIKSLVSDIVYNELGGDDEFLYDEDGELLPDEQIVDSIDEILELGEEAGLCFKDDNNNWAYVGDEDGYGQLQFVTYKLI